MMVVNSLTDMARLAITIQLGNPSDTNSYQILLSAIPLAEIEKVSESPVEMLE